MFCLGICVTLAAQPEPLVQKQSFYSVHYLESRAEGKVGGMILFHGMGMLSNFLSPWGPWEILSAARESPVESGSIACYTDKA